MKYLFTNLAGIFIFDENLNPIEKIEFKDLNMYLEKKNWENKLKKKYPQARALDFEKDKEIIKKILEKIKISHQFYDFNLELTKREIGRKISDDHLIIQSVSNLEELDKIINLLIKRLRNWHFLYWPGLSQIEDNEKFLFEVLKRKKRKGDFGGNLNKEDLEEIFSLAEEVKNLFLLKKRKEEYLKQKLTLYCPNLLKLLGANLAGKLIEVAKGLRNLALMSPGTIQVLGAERALFRHLRTGSKPPKYGYLLQHQSVQQAGDKGKAARILSSQVSLAARRDYFGKKEIG